MATTTPVVLYVYHCAKCGQDGKLHRRVEAVEAL